MRITRKTVLPLLGLFLLGAAAFLSLAIISPPAPIPVEAPVADFSAGRAMQDLEVIAREPHPMGEFPAHDVVRDYLLSEIRSLGLEPQVQDTFGVRVVHPGFILGGAVENILVRLPGSDPDGVILLIAHYDSTPGGPGAGDNGSGVVTLLDVLRNLCSAFPLRQELVFLFADGHESGIIGTHAFVAQHLWFEDISLVINIDTVSNGSPVLAHTNQGNGLWVQAQARTARKPAYLSLPLHLFPSGDSDLIPFRGAGIPGVNFGSSGKAQEIHTGLDRPETVNPGSVQQAGNHILALVRYLGDMPDLETVTAHLPEQTFFPLLGGLVYYPVSWAWPLVIAASLCFLGTMAYGFYKEQLVWKGLGLGLLIVLGCLAFSLGIAYLLWLGVQALHPQYQYSTLRPHLSDDYLYGFGFLAVVLAAAVISIFVARKKCTALDLAAGGLLFWLLATTLATILVPETSYLAAWVLLINSLALMLALIVQSRNAARVQPGLGFLVSAILATFLWMPVLNNAFQGLGLTMIWLVVGVAGLWLAAMLPVLDWISSAKRWLLPAVALLVGVGFLLAGHFRVGVQSPPPPVNSIGYWLEADHNQASWIAFIGGHRIDARTNARVQVAFLGEMDERQERILDNPIRQPYTNLFSKAPPFSVLTSEAPLLALDGPRLEILVDEWLVDRRLVTVLVTASMLDRVYLIVPQENQLPALTVPNNKRIELPAVEDQERVLRLDGTPVEGIEVIFEFSSPGPIQILAVEEKTGLPTFPGLYTQPEPGTMPSPGEFYQGVPADFTAISRDYILEGLVRPAGN